MVYKSVQALRDLVYIYDVATHPFSGFKKQYFQYFEKDVVTFSIACLIRNGINDNHNLSIHSFDTVQRITLKVIFK